MNRDWSRMISVVMSGGQGGRELLEPGLDVVDDLDGVGPRLLLDDQADGVVAVEPGQRARLLERVLGAADVADADRVAVAVGDDQVVELALRC